MKSPRSIAALLLVQAATLMGCFPAPAQCANVWLPGEGVPGTNGIVHAATTWDPDGAGPATPVLVIAGGFALAGNTFANSIAIWNPATGNCSALGSGMNDEVRALTTLPNGDLVAAGYFTTAGGVAANKIARWNGTSWSPLGSGMNNEVRALTTLPNGDIVAAGLFTTAGGVNANFIAQWNGTAWSPLGSGTDNEIRALTTLTNGDLVAGGYFTAAGGVAANNIALWNGISWSALGTGVNSLVFALTALPNGDLVAVGSFTSAGGVSVNYLARWNGTAWSALGSGVGGYLYAITAMPNGDLVVGGAFLTTGSVTANSIARWNGTSWSALGSGMGFYYGAGDVRALTAFPNGDLVAGGNFIAAGGVGTNYIARWNGTAWSSLGSGIGAWIGALTTLPNGDLVAGGYINTASGVITSYIARWNGTAWSALGSGMGGGGVNPSTVHAITTLQNSDLVAAGAFTTAGGIAANHVARWNGMSWSPLGAGLAANILALAVLPNGDLVAGGQYGTIARWNGASWSPLASSMTGSFSNPASVYALATLPNGDLIVGGDFIRVGSVNANFIARWNGSTWSPMGSGASYSVTALTLMPNGDLVAGGAFGSMGGVPASRIARWNGVSWSALGSGMDNVVSAFVPLPNGNLVAGGSFVTAGGNSANRIARWDGTSWSAFGSGMGGGNYPAVSALATLANGDLVAGGSFLTAGGNVSAFFARLTTTCPAAAPSFGPGCSSSIGPMVLTANTLPWVGSTFRSTCTAIAPGSLIFGLFGFASPATPLATLHPAGGVGCSLLASPDAIQMLLPNAGSVTNQLIIPNDPVFAGVVMHDQVLQIELGPASTITRIASSNGLTLTVGAF